MLPVYRRRARGSAHYAFYPSSAPHRLLHSPQNTRETGFYAADQPPQKYQNQIRNTYAPVPRPPQTQAAHFKRLYRKVTRRLAFLHTRYFFRRVTSDRVLTYINLNLTSLRTTP
jgi:hypothetical protein